MWSRKYLQAVLTLDAPDQEASPYFACLMKTPRCALLTAAVQYVTPKLNGYEKRNRGLDSINHGFG